MSPRQTTRGPTKLLASTGPMNSSSPSYSTVALPTNSLLVMLVIDRFTIGSPLKTSKLKKQRGSKPDSAPDSSDKVIIIGQTDACACAGVTTLLIIGRLHLLGMTTVAPKPNKSARRLVIILSVPVINISSVTNCFFR